MPTKDELKMLQSLPLDVKVAKTQQRIREWVDYYGVDGVYVSFSGGKDSTVLLHLVRELYPRVEAVFVDTGLEYPEVRQFAKSHANVTVLRPKMRFDEVIKKYGYPIISKDVAMTIYYARKGSAWALNQRMAGKNSDGTYSRYKDTCYAKYAPLMDLDFDISHMCCVQTKEAALDRYARDNDRVRIVGTMATESQRREQAWLKTGCNAFDAGASKPMSFWTEQDVLQYIRTNNIKIASVYGDIVYKDEPDQLRMEDGYCGSRLRTTGCDRTGCIFCGFGAHLEHGETRFQRLKRTHPKQYAYCIGGGEYGSDGIWRPNKAGLGMYHVFDTLNRIYGADFLRYE